MYAKTKIIHTTKQINMETELAQFDLTFAKYKGLEDRYESQYIFVINGMVVESLIDKVRKMIGIVDAGTNPAKKAYLKTKLNNFVENLLGIKPETKVECIYCVSNSVGYHEFRPYWKETLNSFGCDQLLVKYDNTYQLNWLKNLLLDRSYINVLHLNNNNLRHIHLGLTKKRIHRDKDEKKMDVVLYIQENIRPSEIIIIHGVSSFLKGLPETDKIKVLAGHKRDEELLEEYDKIINLANAEQLQWWLDRMLDPKEGKKLVFGKEIGTGVTDNMIKTIFCSPERSIKLLENYSNDNIQDKLVIVKSYGEDVGKRLIIEFKGAVGVKFY